MTTQRNQLPCLDDGRTDATAPALDAFLASVERRAFVTARLATRDADATLDIVQDVMLRMIDRYAHKDAAEWAPLFFRILSNRIGDHHRRRGFARLLRWRGPENDNSESGADAVDLLASHNRLPDEALDDERMRHRLCRALEQLPERQRQVFLLRQWQGMSVEETAFALQLSGGSVKTHMSRAMKAMRKQLEEISNHEQ